MNNEIKYAVSVCGVPNQNGDGDFYAKVGKTFLNSGRTVAYISVSPDGNESHSYYDIVRIYGIGQELLWEGPLSGLKGVNYAC